MEGHSIQAPSSPMVDQNIQAPSSSMAMDDVYKVMRGVTARGWSSSPPPDQIGEGVARIKDSATHDAPLQLLERCNRLLYGDHTDSIMHDCGVNLLTHLVSRWGELSDELKQKFFPFMARVMASTLKTNAWSTKNKVAFLLAQLISIDMTGIWKELVYASATFLKGDDMKAEINIVRCLSEGIEIPNDDLKAKRSNIVKFQNWDSLLEPLFHLLDKHLAKHNPQMNATQDHYHFALLIAKTLCAYARWVEVKNLVRGVGGTDLIESCTVLLNKGRLVPQVTDYLSEICSRVQPADCTPVVLTGILNTLFKILGDVPQNGGYDELRQTICSSLVSFKKGLGSDFEDLREGVTNLLQRFKAAGLVTDGEYNKLWDELCVDMMTM